MEIKIFYSYSHKDEKHKEKLKSHLSALKQHHKIKELDDRKIDAGDDLNETIKKYMEDADIILLLFSPDFIGSSSCQEEIKEAFRLKQEKGTKVVSIIVRDCAWPEIQNVKGMLALPQDGRPIEEWPSPDKARQSVYDGIHKLVRNILTEVEPEINSEFKDDLLKKTAIGHTLDKLFTYPDISEINSESGKKLTTHSIDSEKLKNLNEFKHNYILIEGEEQSGKTSLCNMLYLHYTDSKFYPVLLKGRNIIGKAKIQKIVSKQHTIQHKCNGDYWSLDKEKRVLLIDDIDERETKSQFFSDFVLSIRKNFNYAIIFIDGLSNLSDKSAEQDYFPYFGKFSIKRFGYEKRNKLIKKCISLAENEDFDDGNNEHLARLDKDTQHINTIIRSNIVPSYPIFIITIFHVVETVTPGDFPKTSYGHCYYTMLVMNLGRACIKPEDIDSYFNFLTELAYFMFNKHTKNISAQELEQFLNHYQKKFVISPSAVKKLKQASIIREKDRSYNFQYIYIYYYFVARYISKNMDDDLIKKRIDELMSEIHKKDNANIIIFITHHTENKYLLNKILSNARSTFDNFKEATLSDDEKTVINKLIDNNLKLTLPDTDHITARQKRLNEKDKIEDVDEKMSDEMEEVTENDFLLIEIRKSAKNMDIIGQILKNQYGSLEKNKLQKLFNEGQNVGLRLLRSFIELITTHHKYFESYIQSQLEQINRNLSQNEKEKESRRIIAYFVYSVIFGWMYKITDSIGYDKLVEIADDVNNKTNTVASKLINLAIHTWHGKNLDYDKVKCLHKEFEKDGNTQALYFLKDIVFHHIYMHPIEYKDRQKIAKLLGYSDKEINTHQLLHTKNMDK